jgi:hypothetical protein
MCCCTLAQLDLIYGRRLAEALLDQPIGHVGLDEVDVFSGQGPRVRVIARSCGVHGA